MKLIVILAGALLFTSITYIFALNARFAFDYCRLKHYQSFIRQQNIKDGRLLQGYRLQLMCFGRSKYIEEEKNPKHHLQQMLLTQFTSTFKELGAYFFNNDLVANNDSLSGKYKKLNVLSLFYIFRWIKVKVFRKLQLLSEKIKDLAQIIFLFIYNIFVMNQASAKYPSSASMKYYDGLLENKFHFLNRSYIIEAESKSVNEGRRENATRKFQWKPKSKIDSLTFISAPEIKKDSPILQILSTKANERKINVNAKSVDGNYDIYEKSSNFSKVLRNLNNQELLPSHIYWPPGAGDKRRLLKERGRLPEIQNSSTINNSMLNASYKSDSPSSYYSDTGPRLISKDIIGESRVHESKRFLGQWALEEQRYMGGSRSNVTGPLKDVITIPSYGSIISSLNGSTGLEWRFTNSTEQFVDTESTPDTSEEILEFRILRGCSSTKWINNLSGTISVAVIRPPKGSYYDQLPRVCHYRGIVIGNRVVGTVFAEANVDQNSITLPESILITSWGDDKTTLIEIGNFQMMKL